MLYRRDKELLHWRKGLQKAEDCTRILFLSQSSWSNGGPAELHRKCHQTGNHNRGQWFLLSFFLDPSSRLSKNFFTQNGRLSQQRFRPGELPCLYFLSIAVGDSRSLMSLSADHLVSMSESAKRSNGQTDGKIKRASGPELNA